MDREFEDAKRLADRARNEEKRAFALALNEVWEKILPNGLTRFEAQCRESQLHDYAKLDRYVCSIAGSERSPSASKVTRAQIRSYIRDPRRSVEELLELSSQNPCAFESRTKERAASLMRTFLACVLNDQREEKKTYQQILDELRSCARSPRYA